MNDVTSREHQEGIARENGRLPPGQSLTLKFPILHYGPVPTFDPATWTLRCGEKSKNRSV